MNTPKTNNDLLQLMQVEKAINEMILQEVSDIKKNGGNGETLLSNRIIIRNILEKERAIEKLMEAEQQLRDKVYHKGMLTKFVWKLKWKLRRFLGKKV